MAVCVALEDILEEVTRSDTEDAQDSTDEETDQKTKAIESAINYFAECINLGKNIRLFQLEANRYLKVNVSIEQTNSKNRGKPQKIDFAQTL